MYLCGAIFDGAGAWKEHILNGADGRFLFFDDSYETGKKYPYTKPSELKSSIVLRFS